MNRSFIAKDAATPSDWEVAVRESFGRLANRATFASSSLALKNEIELLDAASVPLFVACLVDERCGEPFQHAALVQLVPPLAKRHYRPLEPLLPKLVAFLIRRIAEYKPLLEQPLRDAFAALARYLVADAMSNIAADVLGRLTRPLLTSLARKIDGQQRFAALCFAAVVRGAATNVLRDAAPELLDRLLEIGATCTDAALPELLSALVAFADVLGTDDAVLERALPLLRLAARTLDSPEPRARTAAADALLALAKAFHDVALASAPEMIAALDAHRYDTAKLVRTAVVAAINHYEFVASGAAGDAPNAPLPTQLPSTTPAVARSRAATPLRSPAPSASSSSSEPRRSVFASKPNASFFVDSSPSGDSHAALSLVELKETPAQAQRRFEEALHQTPTARSVPILGGAGASQTLRSLGEMNAQIKQLQDQQASMLEALDGFSSRVSVVLASMNDRLCALERHVGMASHDAPVDVHAAAAAASAPIDEEKRQLHEVEVALEAADGLTPAQRDAGLKTVASLFDCESDAALLGLLAVIDAHDALTALSRVQPAGVRLARTLVRRAATAAASAGTTSGELTTCGVRWAATALEVELRGVAADASTKPVGLWTDGMTSADYGLVRKAIQRCAGRPGASGFDAARVFAAMPMAID
jgi:hypothetical protein